MNGPLVVYDTRTGNVRRFVNKLGARSIFLRSIEKINEPFVLITYTDKFGEVPPTTQKFLQSNYEFLLGVSASGNRNWRNTFAKSADKISQQFKVPIISKFELSGSIEDVKTFIERVDQFEFSDIGKYELLRA